MGTLKLIRKVKRFYKEYHLLNTHQSPNFRIGSVSYKNNAVKVEMSVPVGI